MLSVWLQRHGHITVTSSPPQVTASWIITSHHMTGVGFFKLTLLTRNKAQRCHLTYGRQGVLNDRSCHHPSFLSFASYSWTFVTSFPKPVLWFTSFLIFNKRYHPLLSPSTVFMFFTSRGTLSKWREEAPTSMSSCHQQVVNYESQSTDLTWVRFIKRWRNRIT